MLHLECPFDTLIEVSKTMLGRQNSITCTGGDTGATGATSTCEIAMQDYVVTRCEKKTMCDIAVPMVPRSASQCQKISRSVYFEVTYSCYSKCHLFKCD